MKLGLRFYGVFRLKVCLSLTFLWGGGGGFFVGLKV